MGNARTLREVFLSTALAAHVIFDSTNVSIFVSAELVTEVAEHDETHSAHLETCARHGIHRASAARASFCGLDGHKKNSVRNMFFVNYYVIFYTRWNDGKTGLPGQSILNRLPGFRNLE